MNKTETEPDLGVLSFPPCVSPHSQPQNVYTRLDKNETNVIKMLLASFQHICDFDAKSRSSNLV